MKRRLLEYQEKYANSILYDNGNFLIDSKVKNIKSKISKALIKSKQCSDMDRINWLFDEIENDTVLARIAKKYDRIKSINILQKYLKKQNMICKKFGYETIKDAVVAKLKKIFGENFDFLSFCKKIIDNCYKSYEENDQVKDGSYRLKSKQLIDYLTEIDIKLKDFYYQMNVDGLILDKNPTEFGALTLHFPVSKKDLILIEDLDCNTDYLLHELGHVLYNRIKRSNIDKEVCYDLCDEIVSSALEYLYLSFGKNYDKIFTPIYNDFITRTQILTINSLFLMEICGIKEMDNIIVNETWQSILSKLNIHINSKKNVSFNNCFKLTTSFPETLKYLMGKGIAILLSRNNKLSYQFLSDSLTKMCLTNNLDFNC